MSELKKNEIFAKLPDYFWTAFAGELVAVFGIDIFDKDEDGLQQLDYMGGTSGWAVALWSVCHRLGIEWFYEWYDALDWMDSDEFDGDLLDELNRRVGSCEVSAERETNRAYYRWLIDKRVFIWDMEEDAKSREEAET